MRRVPRLCQRPYTELSNFVLRGLVARQVEHGVEGRVAKGRLDRRRRSTPAELLHLRE